MRLLALSEIAVYKVERMKATDISQTLLDHDSRSKHGCDHNNDTFTQPWGGGLYPFRPLLTVSVAHGQQGLYASPLDA